MKEGEKIDAKEKATLENILEKEKLLAKDIKPEDEMAVKEALKAADKDVDMELHDADDYGHEHYELDMYADEVEDMSNDSEASLERHAATDAFKDTVPLKIVDSSLPEDQQMLLVKLMARQHNFLVGFLHTYAEGQPKRDEDEGSADGEHAGEDGVDCMLNEDEVYALQCRIDDFQ